MKNTYYKGDCLDVMPLIPDASVDMVLCDLPQGITKNRWDSVIPFENLWDQYERVIKPNGAIILFGNGLFTARLIVSNAMLFRYTLIWQKTGPSNPFNAKRMPLRDHEDIVVFYKKPPVYNPQKTTGHPRKISSAHHKRNSRQSSNYGASVATSYDSTERYPKSVWKFAVDKQKSAVHATQKPIQLIEQLILSYSNEGDLILDNCAGSFTTGIACVNTKRGYILIEKDPVEFENGENRLLAHLNASSL